MALQGLVNAGMSRAQIARAIGESAAFVGRVLGKRERLKAEHLRMLRRNTGRSAELWVLDSIERSPRTPAQQKVLDDGRAVIEQWDALLAKVDGRT